MSKLPPDVIVTRSGYYLVHQGIKRKLTDRRTELGAAIDRVRPLLTKQAQKRQAANGPNGWVARFVRGLVYRAKISATARGVEFSIDEADALACLERASYRCAVTGIDFNLDQHGNTTKRPFAPSIDRIDSKNGYTRTNIRIVCAAANVAIGAWGEDVLFRIASSMVKHRP